MDYNSDGSIDEEFEFDIDTIIEPNEFPSDPQIIGPSSGKKGINLEYKFVSFDSEDDNLSYFIEWGDGTNSSWIGPYNSDEEISIEHTWNEENDYIIRAIVKDGRGAYSNWSSIDINISKSKTFTLHDFLIRFLDDLPLMFPILRQILGLN